MPEADAASRRRTVLLRAAALPSRQQCRTGGCRSHHQDGYEYARRGLEIPWPSSGLFVEDWVYNFGLLDELAVSAYWTERYQECLEACERLLGEGKMPHDMHSRVTKNAEFAANKIRLQSLAVSPPIASKSRVILQRLYALLQNSLSNDDYDARSVCGEAQSVRFTAISGWSCRRG